MLFTTASNRVKSRVVTILVISEQINRIVIHWKCHLCQQYMAGLHDKWGFTFGLRLIGIFLSWEKVITTA